MSGIDETCEQGSTTQLSRQNSENSKLNAIENDEMDNGDEVASDHEGYEEESSGRKREQTLGENNVEPARTSEKTESVFEESPTFPLFSTCSALTDSYFYLASFRTNACSREEAREVTMCE